MFSAMSFSAMEMANLGALYSTKTSSSSSSSMINFNFTSSINLLPKRRSGFVISASIETNSDDTLARVEFEPFEELKKEGFMVPAASQLSIARQGYSAECEAAVNEQIKTKIPVLTDPQTINLVKNVEYNVSYVYHAMYAYIDRDNVALKGFARLFKVSSEKNRARAETLMKYQNSRGGRVKLHSIIMPPSEYDHQEKGEALYVMELALSLEKLTTEKLLNLHSVAGKSNDPQLAEFIESDFLAVQVDTIKKIGDYISQLRRVGKGHGVWDFDQSLLEDEAAP